MLPHLQLSHFHRIALEENLHFTLPTSILLRKKDTMSFLILVSIAYGIGHCCYSINSYSCCLDTFFTCLLTGVAVGPELCGPESPAIRDPNLWVVTVGEFVAKMLIFN